MLKSRVSRTLQLNGRAEERDKQPSLAKTQHEKYFCGGKQRIYLSKKETRHRADALYPYCCYININF
jgi:hypothetical protein